jgi:hypothetical protein
MQPLFDDKVTIVLVNFTIIQLIIWWTTLEGNFFVFFVYLTSYDLLYQFLFLAFPIMVQFS